jgi:polysaccharide export outer membrane protein
LPQSIAQSPAPLGVATAGARELPQGQPVLPAPEVLTTPPPEGAEIVPGLPADHPRLVPEPPVVAVADHPLHHGDVPREDAKQSFPEYRVAPPDILLIQGSRAITLPIQALDGPHLVRPDGTISLGIYGTVYVAGLTLEEIRDAVAVRLKAVRDQARAAKIKTKDEKDKDMDLDDLSPERIKLELTVDVLAYNSQYYYVITDGGGYGEQVYRYVATGNETVLDALSQINGLPAVASKKHIWLARATHVYPVDWRSITQVGAASTNYQVFPGDRIYVNSDKLIRTDSFLAKFLSPAERILGVTLLGSSTVNSIRSRTGTGSGTGGVVP